jgi:hypothetical protein
VSSAVEVHGDSYTRRPRHGGNQPFPGCAVQGLDARHAGKLMPRARSCDGSKLSKHSCVQAALCHLSLPLPLLICNAPNLTCFCPQYKTSVVGILVSGEQAPAANVLSFITPKAG